MRKIGRNPGLSKGPGIFANKTNQQQHNNSPAAASRPAEWWGHQACTCRGAGACLCCRRFARAIRAHQARCNSE